MSGKHEPFGFLSITPTELKFSYKLKKDSVRYLHLTNNTDQIVAFRIKETNPKEFSNLASLKVGVVLPKDTCDVVVRMHPRKKAPLGVQGVNKLIVQSVLVPKGTIVRDLSVFKILRWVEQSKEKSLRTINVILSTPKAEEHPPKRSVICLKDRKLVKDVEKTEDCFILEFDPYESFDFSSLRKSINQIDESASSIVVVAERGKVACRDYPHPRHLCAVHPFNKSAHKTYCKMCYCYVCDTPAPCKKWTNVARDNSGMHCDATEDIQSWRIRRQVKISRTNVRAAVRAG